MPHALLFAAALLTFSFAGTAGVLLVQGDQRRLRARLAAAGQSGAVPDPAAAPSIRSAREGAWTRVVRTLLLLPPDHMVSRLSPRLVVSGSTAASAAFAFFVAPRWGLAAAAMVLIAGSIGLTRLVFARERRRWREALFVQVADVVGLMMSTLRSGIPLGEAMRSVAREIPSPSREQFVRVVAEIGIGQPLEAALWRVHERTGVTEYGFLAVTVGVQTQTGGSLTETLDNLQDMVRRRVAVARRGRAMAAEARTSAIILEGLPFVAAAAMQVLNPGYFVFFTDTPGGQYLLLAAAGLFGCGVLSIQTLIRRSLSE